MIRTHHFFRRHALLAVPVAALMLVVGSANAGGDDKQSGGASDEPMTEMQQRVHDAWLDGKLESALLFNRHLNSFDIDTEIENGTAILSGAVESEIDKELAGEVARSVEGIEEVENQLTVDSEAAMASRESESYEQKSEWRQAVSDATLTAMVKSRLLVNEHTSGLKIDVDTEDGVVTLSGTVQSDEEAALAAQIAENVEDTRDVKNRLQVEPKQRG